MARVRHSTSAGLLLHGRGRSGQPLVFLAHPGGPFWSHRDEGTWGIPKGEYDEATEDAWTAARREFAEEIGIPAPPGEPQDLGVAVQPSGKRIRTFALEVTGDPTTISFVASNTFDLEWPKGSGRLRAFPEIDRAQWFDLATARVKALSGHVPIIETLAGRRGWT